jgi:chemotaxis protein CheD
MNHFLLPEGSDSIDLRFASAAMERLVNALIKAGAHKHNLKAKLFGGAQMMSGLPDIGRRNGEAALGFLRLENIPVVSTSLGGNEARRVRFWPTSGRAQLLLVGGAIDEPLPPKKPDTGSIELF